MPTTTTYELGVSGSSFTGAANREDLLDVITIISPVDTPLFTMFRKTKVSNVQVEWLTDLLDQATTNAVADGSSASFQSVTPRVRLSNFAQISRESYDVSDTQRAVNRLGSAPWQHGDEKSAVCWKPRVSDGTGNRDNPFGAGNHAGNRKGAPETTRGPSHAEDDMVRPARRRAEAGGNDRPRRKTSNNSAGRNPGRTAVPDGEGHRQVALAGNRKVRIALYAGTTEYAGLRDAA